MEDNVDYQVELAYQNGRLDALEWVKANLNLDYPSDETLLEDAIEDAVQSIVYLRGG